MRTVRTGPPPLSLPFTESSWIPPFRGDGKVYGDVAVAGVRVEVGGEAVGQAQGDAAIAGVDRPAGGHVRAGSDFRLDVAIATA